MKNLQVSLLLLAAIGTALSTSCATTRGLGQDLQKVGSKLETQADATGGAVPLNTTGNYQTSPPAY